jgi:protein TonB
MTNAIGSRRDTKLAGWPFWASMIAHLVGIGAVSAVAVTSAAPPPPVPIELVRIETPEPPAPAGIPKPRPVKAPVSRPILQQPMTAPVPAASEPPALLDDAPRVDTAPRTPEPAAPDRRFLASASAGSGVTSTAPAGAGALFSTGDLPVVAGRGTSGGRGGDGTGQAMVSTGTSAGLTDFARPLGGYQTTPRYPESARRQGVEGITTLRFVVLANGHVGQVAVARSAGHIDLDRAAVEAVRTWRFQPARRGREAVDVWVTLPVRFELHNE